MTETALLRWRYNPDRNEVPGLLNVKCYYGENVEKPIITRTGTNNPDVQDNLNGRVEAFVDPTDNTIFGFKIKRASKSDQKEYKCLAGFGIQIPGRNLTVDTALSNTLILEVVGNIRVLLSFFKVASMVEIASFDTSKEAKSEMFFRKLMFFFKL